MVTREAAPRPRLDVGGARVDQPAADRFIDFGGLGIEWLAFLAVGAQAVPGVGGFLGVVQDDEALVFVVGGVTRLSLNNL